MAEKKTAAKTAKAEKPAAKPAKKTAVEAQPRLKALYNNELKAKLQKELGLKNVNQVPELKKIIVSSGVGKKREDKRFTETVALTLEKITGQKATSRLAKKSIATFKIRKGMGAPVGYLTTLRNDKMYEFVDRLINVALPHVRDFHGVSRKAFDAQGNYSLGLREQTVFPEITFEDASVLHGLEVTFIIKNGSKEGSLKLLELFGMPFEKEAK
jgi:large subunit ribosomal protein L5